MRCRKHFYGTAEPLSLAARNRCTSQITQLLPLERQLRASFFLLSPLTLQYSTQTVGISNLCRKINVRSIFCFDACVVADQKSDSVCLNGACYNWVTMAIACPWCYPYEMAMQCTLAGYWRGAVCLDNKRKGSNSWCHLWSSHILSCPVSIEVCIVNLWAAQVAWHGWMSGAWLLQAWPPASERFNVKEGWIMDVSVQLRLRLSWLNQPEILWGVYVLCAKFHTEILNSF